MAASDHTTRIAKRPARGRSAVPGPARRAGGHPDRFVSRAGLAIALFTLAVQAYPLVKSSVFPDVTCAHPGGRAPLHGMSATATSTLPEETGHTYEARNAVDGDMKTAWAPAGGDGGYGKRLSIQLDSPTNLVLACIVNGYAASADLYVRNARVRDVSVETAAGYVNGTLTDLPPSEFNQYQDLPLPRGRTDFVTITIMSFDSGTSNDGHQGYLDTCVSEILLYPR